MQSGVGQYVEAEAAVGDVTPALYFLCTLIARVSVHIHTRRHPPFSFTSVYIHVMVL